MAARRDPVRRSHLGDALKYRSGHAGRLALTSVTLAAMWVASGSAWALGLGRLNVQSALGETLRAEIDITSLTAEEDSSLRVRIAPPDSYRAAGVEYNLILPSTRAEVARRADGRPYLRLTSERAVQEPFVDVILELTWASGRLVREYTLLLDPPQSRTAPPVQAAAPTAPVIAAAPPPLDSRSSPRQRRRDRLHPARRPARSGWASM